MNEFWGFLTGILAAVLPGFGAPAEPVYAGYVEADYVYASPASGGPIERLAVGEGEEVKQGQLLFVLASSQQRSLLASAEARAAAARANWQNLSTGSRSEDLDVIRASLEKAEADLGLADATLERSRRLFAAGTIAQAQLDQSEASVRSATAQANQFRAQLAVAELPARNAQLISAQATLTAAEADAEKAKADLSDRSVLAPADGRVEEVFFSAGEMAAAGMPVLSLLPPQALVAKFYLPEPDRAHFSLGETVAIACDGCPAGLTAKLTRIASQPQFTAPIIYSREERARLVYLVEAHIEGGAGLLPGQPIDVRAKK